MNIFLTVGEKNGDYWTVFFNVIEEGYGSCKMDEKKAKSLWEMYKRCLVANYFPGEFLRKVLDRSINLRANQEIKKKLLDDVCWKILKYILTFESVQDLRN